MLMAMAASTLPLAAQTTDLPYDISFTADNYATWTAVDDGQSDPSFKNLMWMWNENSWWYSLTSGQKTDANDWVLSPSFSISAGTQYEITYRIDRYTGNDATVTL